MPDTKVGLVELQMLYTGFRNEAFRLELRDRYQVEGEWEQFQDYLAGRSRPQDQDFEAFCHSISETVRAGRSMFIVHVVPPILSPYLKFEFSWFYVPRQQAGEQISVLEQDRFRALWPAHLEMCDFWLFDERDFVKLVYDDDDRFLYGVHVTDVGRVQEYVHTKNELLRTSTPFASIPASAYL